MNKGLAAILGLLALIMGVGAVVTLRDQGASTTPATESKLGQPLLPQLKAAEVARITIRAPRATLTLEKKNEHWVINERGGFPADLDKVTELVVKAIELKIGQAEGIGEKDRARMQLVAPAAATPAATPAATAATVVPAIAAPSASVSAEGAATSLVFAGADGKTLAELWLGKKYFKTAPEGDATKALGDGRFVMLPSDQTRVVVVADPLKQATANAGDWIAREGVVIENIKSLEVKLPAGGYRVSRAILDTPWELDGAAAKSAMPAASKVGAAAGKAVAAAGKNGAAGGKGGKGGAVAGAALDQSRANNASYALAKLDLDDAATAGIVAGFDKGSNAGFDKGSNAGFDQGSEIIAATYDGLEYRIKVGRLDGTRYLVQVALQGDASRPAPSAPANEKAEDKDKREKAFAEQTKTLNARITREKALGPFTLLISKAKFDEVLKPREAMLQQPAKDAKK